MLLMGSFIGLYIQSGRIRDLLDWQPFLAEYPQNLWHRPQKEHRRDRRSGSRLQLELEEKTGLFVPGGTVVNLSPRGACLMSSLTFKPGQRIYARLHPSHEGLLKISGKIIWLKPQMNNTLYGLSFERESRS